MAGLVYYLRCHQNDGQPLFCVESLPDGDQVELVPGFIRRTPEIKHPDDMTDELLSKFTKEIDNYRSS